MDEELVADYRQRVCIPRGHAHGVTPRDMIVCALTYLAENGESGGVIA